MFTIEGFHCNYIHVGVHTFSSHNKRGYADDIIPTHAHLRSHGKRLHGIKFEIQVEASGISTAILHALLDQYIHMEGY